MKRLLLAVSFLAISTTIFAQNNANTIRQRTDLADLVIEGRIIKTTPFWNQSHTKIFTSNLVDISRIFKGEVVGEQIEIITQGGVVGEDFSIIADGLKFTSGVEGVFFLKSNAILPNLGNTQNLAYTSKKNDFIQYHFEEFNPPASDLTGHYKNINSEIWKNIVLSSRTPIRQIKPSRVDATLKKALSIKTDAPEFTDKSIHYTFENVSITNFQTIEFDLYVHASENGLLFGKANVYISYNTDVFGSSIVSNNNLTASKETVILNSAYTLTKSDQATNIVKLEVVSSFSSPGTAPFSLTTVPEKFCHMELPIEDYSALANISFDDFQMIGNSWYVTPRVYDYIPFDRVEVENPINAAVLDKTVLIHYDFDNINVTAEGVDHFLEFDVVASSNVNWTRLGQADVFIGYNGDAFGESPEFSYELNSDMVDFEYISYAQDYPGFFKELYMAQLGPDSLKYITLSTNPKTLAHCKMKVQDCSQRAGLTYSTEYMANLQFYYVKATIPYGEYSFGDTEFGAFNQYICLDSAPIITKIYPKVLRAGVSDVLTIEGRFLKQGIENGSVYF